MRNKFDRDFDRAEKAFWFMWFLTIAIVLGFLCGGGFVVYKLLIHFGIM